MGKDIDVKAEVEIEGKVVKKKPPRYDWKKYTKEYVMGAFLTITEYIEFNEERRKKFGEERPSGGAISKASKKLNWVKLRMQREERIADDVLSQTVDAITDKKIDEIVDLKLITNNALAKILVYFANNPKELSVRADLSDLTNDLKRGINMTTKEQQVTTSPQIQLNQANVDLDSFRRKLEDSSKDERKEIRQQTKENIKKLKSSISDEDYSFLEDDGSDE